MASILGHHRIAVFGVVQFTRTRARSTTEDVAKMPFAFRTTTGNAGVNVSSATLETDSTATPLVIAIFRSNYLRQGGYVFVVVCLFVSNFAQKLLNGFA